MHIYQINIIFTPAWLEPRNYYTVCLVPKERYTLIA